jgi:hypothetical protein
MVPQRANRQQEGEGSPAADSPRNTSWTGYRRGSFSDILCASRGVQSIERRIMTQTDRSNRFVLALLAVLGAFLLIIGWYRFAG